MSLCEALPLSVSVCVFDHECFFFSICQLLLMSKEIDVRELDFLLRFNIDHQYVSPVEFLSNSAWSAIKVQRGFVSSQK